MQKFINRAENITSEALEALVLAHSDELALVGERLVVNKKLAQAERVAVVALGGACFEPALSGFVGEGLLDVFACGDVLAAPGPQVVLDALQLADRGQGVLLVCGRDTGAELSARIAVQQAKKLGLAVELVFVQDNIASADYEHRGERSALGGCFVICKLAAAAAAAGRTLAEVQAVCERAVQQLASLAVVAGVGTNPATGRPLAEAVEAGYVRVGTDELGAGGELLPRLTADALAELAAARLIADLQLEAGAEVLFIVSGSGAATLAEQLIVFRSCYKQLAERGIRVAAQAVAPLMTAFDTQGLQLIMLRLDAELAAYWQARCRTPYYKN